jgi:hypothetical protein
MFITPSLFVCLYRLGLPLRHNPQRADTVAEAGSIPAWSFQADEVGLNDAYPRLIVRIALCASPAEEELTTGRKKVYADHVRQEWCALFNDDHHANYCLQTTVCKFTIQEETVTLCRRERFTR